MGATGVAGRDPANVFIVGAGFSKNAGLPLATELTQRLLDGGKFAKGMPSRGLVELIRHFVQANFGHSISTPADRWPELEDLFTVIDLSANTGHHLGKEFSPAVLRTVRRALIVRTIRMLNQRYKRAKTDKLASLKQLAAFFAQVEPAACAFLSMNWDTVIEQGLQDAHGLDEFDYGCGAQGALFEKERLLLRIPTQEPAVLLKPHGSFNWLYCDACRHVFWTRPEDTEKVAGQLFSQRDWDTVERLTTITSKASKPRPCPSCGAEALGTRIATFSYRKALEFPMHARTWQATEEVLYTARNWIFIGYSLPAADYEFKLLLKRVQLSRFDKPNIVLVTGGGVEAAERTRLAYEKFFGPDLGAGGSNVFLNGLDAAALKGLADLGCLSKTRVSKPAKRPPPTGTPGPAARKNAAAPSQAKAPSKPSPAKPSLLSKVGKAKRKPASATPLGTAASHGAASKPKLVSKTSAPPKKPLKPRPRGV